MRFFVIYWVRGPFPSDPGERFEREYASSLEAKTAVEQFRDSGFNAIYEERKEP